MFTPHRHRFALAAFVLLIALTVLCGCSSSLEKDFALSKTELELMQGNSATLILQTADGFDDEFTTDWSSDDPAVASVDENGTVTANAVGTCAVSVRVTCDGDTLDLSCTVTVTENTTPLTGIAFASNLYSIGGNQTLDLNSEVVFYPANAAGKVLTWSTSAPTVATVRNGIVTPVSEGAATITALSADGKFNAQCIVRVSSLAVEATGIRFAEEEHTIARGQTYVLTPTVEPANATGYSLSWSSSNPDVATVSAGNVTGLAEGAAVISVKLIGGAEELTADLIIRVSKDAVVVRATDVSLTPANLTISEESTETYRFTAKITPGNCTEEAIWSSSNPSLLTIDEHTGKFSVTGTPSGATGTAVIVTCRVGSVSGQGVVLIQPEEEKLELSETQVRLYSEGPEAEIQLCAALTKTQDLPDVTWKSSDPTVAKVDASGNVTAVGKGSCTITAKCTDKPELTATCRVTVEDPPYLVLEVSKTRKLTADDLPADATGWDFDSRYFSLNTETLMLTGLRETMEGPEKLTGYSAANPQKTFSILIYVMSQK